MAKTRFTADLPHELYTWLMEYSKQYGLSRNAVIEKALLELQSNKKDDEK